VSPRRRATATSTRKRPPATRKAPQTHLPRNFDHATASALGKLVEHVISDPSQRQAFREDPEAAAMAAGVTKVTPKVKKVMLTLAGMSPSELRLLSELNETLIKERLYVETGNPPLMVF
jgi:hypothetical protein